MTRADNPNDVKQGGFCLYLIESFKLRHVSTLYLLQYLFCDVTDQNMRSFIVIICRSPSQTADEFNNFQLDLERLLGQIKYLKPTFTEVLGAFNPMSKSRWSENIITNEGSQIEFVATTYWLHQLISDSTHIPTNNSSCISLILTDQPNLVINGGVHLSLHPN